MPNYGDARYWDERYTQQKATTFDWLESWDDIKEIAEKHAIDGIYSKDGAVSSNAENTKTALKVLNLGCGNSILCEDMYDEGYQQIWNMDISSVCIQQMGDRNKKQRPEMKWEVMDVRELKYPSEMFDLVVDKSTIDALLCGNFAYLNVAIMLKECQRVLKTGGYYMAISYGVPENRDFHLIREHLKLEVNTYKIEKKHEGSAPPSTHYIYVAKKLPGADKQCDEKWSLVMN